VQSFTAHMPLLMAVKLCTSTTTQTINAHSLSASCTVTGNLVQKEVHDVWKKRRPQHFVHEKFKCITVSSDKDHH